jgi:hypothetical protein
MKINNPEEILIRLILRRFGINAYDYSGMKQLALSINQKFGEKVSVNTLARIAGLRSDTRKPYLHTLDLLAKTAAFNCYKTFETYVRQKSCLQLTDNQELLKPFVANYTKTAILNNDIAFLKNLIGHIEKNGCTIEDSFSIAYAMVEGLRQNKNPKDIIRVLVKCPVSIDLFFENYIDRDHFAGYYGKSMIDIADQTKEGDRIYLLANAIALYYEKSNNMLRSYKQRGKKLAGFSPALADKMLQQGWVFPVARWMGALTDFHYTNGDKKQADKIIEKVIDYSSFLNSDEQMILLSEVSVTSNHLDVPLRNKLVDIYRECKDRTVIEFDSLVHAGLNFMSVDKSTHLLTYRNVESYISKYPLQFSMCKSTLQKKAVNLFR